MKQVDEQKNPESRSAATSCYPSRYGFQSGDGPELTASMFMSGPQDRAQVPQEIQEIFAKSKMKIKFVAVIYEGVTGRR